MHLRHRLHVRGSIIAILLWRFLESARQPVAEAQARLDLRRAAGRGRGHGLQPEVETTPENTATAKIAQINNVILQHVIAIDIDPASPAALNPVITKARNAEIIDYRRGIRLDRHGPV
jgi:hypothetical protein